MNDDKGYGDFFVVLVLIAIDHFYIINLVNEKSKAGRKRGPDLRLHDRTYGVTEAQFTLTQQVRVQLSVCSFLFSLIFLLLSLFLG